MRRYISKDIAVAVSFILMYMEKKRDHPTGRFRLKVKPFQRQIQRCSLQWMLPLPPVRFLDGKQQSRDLFNKSNYQATPKLITIGTKDATSETLSALKAAITTGDEAKVRSAAAGLKTNAQKKDEEQKEEEKKDDTDKKEDADKSDTNKKEDSSKKDENNKKEDTKKEDSKKQDTKKETTSSTNTSTKKTQSSKESE